MTTKSKPLRFDCPWSEDITEKCHFRYTTIKQLHNHIINYPHTDIALHCAQLAKNLAVAHILLDTSNVFLNASLDQMNKRKKRKLHK